MAAVLTPARAELLPSYASRLGCGGQALMPSAMPAPPPSVSPRVTTAPFPAPPKLAKPRGDLPFSPSSHAPSTSRSQSQRDGKFHFPVPETRSALANVNTNRVLLKHTRSIPRLAPTPDVFAAGPLSERRSASNSISQFPPTSQTNPSLPVGKRFRETPGPPVSGSESKRLKVEEVKAEGEKWRAKWVKMFPTLVFHFEIGAEVAGRNLKGRVLQMGAKVDQFFSTRVTHLVVRSHASPQKARSLSSRRDLSRESPKNPFLDGTGTTDLAKKADAMGMKVWNVKKLADILERLAPAQQIAKHDSLHTLLEDERLHGTRERDFSAPRPDHYYFPAGNKYLLIEDATGKHRPIMTKEYTKEETYPVLYDGFLRVSSSNASETPVEKIRDRAWALYVDREDFEGETPPGELRRSVSLRSINGTPKLPAPAPYQNASGNSVVITSNIASTCNGNPSPAFPALGRNALVQMSRRVQVLKGNANARMQGLGQQDLPHRRASIGAGHSLQPKTFMTQEQVYKMLKQARMPDRGAAPTADERRENRAKVDAGLKGKDQDSAAGYCENCRIRYNDLSVHVVSKKHRRFARDPANFAELDKLLCTLRRPPHPLLFRSEYPPCDEAHSASAECDLCEQQVVEEDSTYDSEDDEDETEGGCEEDGKEAGTADLLEEDAGSEDGNSLGE